MLVLEDGSVFEGFGFGVKKKVVGEVVFNTGMVGYVEALTDPSYTAQILVSTYPLIGNYGVPLNKRDCFGLLESFESDHIMVEGFVVSEICKNPSHHESGMSLNEWFVQHGKCGIDGIDTREIVKKIREYGTMKGILEVGHPKKEELLSEITLVEDPNKKNLVAAVSKEVPVVYGNGKKKIVLIDCGLKANILREILKQDTTVLRVPYNTTAEQILEQNPDAVVVSNGPGDPKMLKGTISMLKTLIANRVPLFGICLGCQLLALALGADTYKLKYGHRSQNQPCVEVNTKKCYITSQNHGFAIKRESLPKSVIAWFENANDKTVEGICHKDKPIAAVQFHPEATPGPNDTSWLFDDFLKGLNND